MSAKLSLITKKEVLKKIKEKYKQVHKKDKSSIINTVVELTGYDRKYVIHQLNKNYIQRNRKPRVVNNLKYTDHLKTQLIKIWYASNKICSKRLVPFLPEMIPTLESNKHLQLNN